MLPYWTILSIIWTILVVIRSKDYGTVTSNEKKCRGYLLLVFVNEQFSSSGNLYVQNHPPGALVRVATFSPLSYSHRTILIRSGVLSSCGYLVLAMTRFRQPVSDNHGVYRSCVRGNTGILPPAPAGAMNNQQRLCRCQWADHGPRMHCIKGYSFLLGSFP
jgi:hypothetical protein